MTTPPRNPKIKAVFFDFMGTCLDWHSGVLSALPASIPPAAASSLAITWRHTYFAANAARLAANLAPENIDTTLRTTLLHVLNQPPHSEHRSLFLGEDKQDPIARCVAAFHSMPAWPDVPDAIAGLKGAGYEVFVFANGSPRLQLDLCRSSGLGFDMLFSSELLGVYKPARESYERVLAFVKVRPEEAVQVAAHAYDTRGAKEVGMRTVYVRRWTDDVDEDMEVVKGENDVFLEDMSGVVEAIARL
ncbi:(S)-2-haloacid dehalogenase IVA [Lasiosphaeria hispida]|uniref:(S)-2-haloacid dehalogenase IVA n=1 Tax=Lasiosphaeria hispida TaxID=260671 RepID=A0AAJ0HPI0_9PEZI|nr:(S)-2-haloacid dehalogenase IVA [Lasiosphaeria hispida]